MENKWKNMSCAPLDGQRIIVHFRDNKQQNIVECVTWENDGLSGAWFNGHSGIGKGLEAIKWCDCPKLEEE